jgi:hypothetical protein
MNFLIFTFFFLFSLATSQHQSNHLFFFCFFLVLGILFWEYFFISKIILKNIILK